MTLFFLLFADDYNKENGKEEVIENNDLVDSKSDLSTFENMLKDLESMGFADKQRNIELIEKYQDLSLVIQELLNEKFDVLEINEKK